MKKLILGLIFILNFAPLFSQTFKFSLQEFAAGFVKPIDIVGHPDGRLFVVEQRGTVKIVQPDGTVLPDLFVDLQSIVSDNANERGLLGFAFDPNVEQNGFFYINYSDNSGGDTQISRFSIDPNNPNKALATSELKIIEIDQPFSNHNGGCLKFGPDGYLYVGMGDGGSGGDPQQFSQNKQSLLGKMLRLDVSAGVAGIPADNPFVNDPNTADEIYFIGLRNPWRFSFDKQTGDIWIGDVGQNAREEIDFAPANTGGLNFGWRCREGLIAGTAGGNCPPDSEFTNPVFQWTNPSVGCSVTGGYVYRGTGYPNWNGIYFCADYCSGRFWKIEKDQATGNFAGQEIGNFADSQTTSFGEGSDGKLYSTGHLAGKIYRLCSTFTATANAQNETCAGANDGAVSLIINDLQGSASYLWSDGSTQKDLTNVPAGNYTVTVSDGNGCTVKVTQNLTNNSIAAPTITASGSLQLCPGQTVSLSASPAPAGYGVQWFLDGQAITGANFSPYLVGAPGNYSAVFTGNCNSNVSNSLTLSLQNPTPPTISITGNNLLGINPNFTQNIQWFLNGIAIPGANSSSFLAVETGNYSVAATDSQTGCLANSAEIFVEIIGVEWPTEIKNCEIAPNPFSNSVNISMEFFEKTNVKFQIFDTAGKIVREKKMSGAQISALFEMADVPAGTYFLKISTPKNSIFRQIIKS